MYNCQHFNESIAIILTNGVEIGYRCPNIDEPADNLSSYTCTHKSQCGPAGRLCCKAYSTGDRRCVDGILLEPL
ncbi:hypothetical protein EB796_003131 [Bugula neritina]|uniref:Uncharacterized protein n=1 Tax=Bugula neritina TaxID=10212 RepID=A0A7J7KJ00_BUGNE|nr:hypothetical protein EB796_003131 [Bugula neritina]